MLVVIDVNHWFKVITNKVVLNKFPPIKIATNLLGIWRQKCSSHLGAKFKIMILLTSFFHWIGLTINPIDPITQWVMGIHARCPKKVHLLKFSYCNHLNAWASCWIHGALNIYRVYKKNETLINNSNFLLSIRFSTPGNLK
jgi:hypothetical protein